MKRTHDILSLGAIYLDIISRNFPFGNGLLPETEIVGSKYEMVLGGSAVNAARFSAKLGLRSVFFGKVGDDQSGKLVHQLLEATGIAPHLLTDATVQTNLGINYVDPHGRTLNTVVGSANQSLTPSDVQKNIEELLPIVSYLYLGGFFKLKSLQPLYKTLVQQAHAVGTKVIFDHGRISNLVTEEEKAMVRELVSMVDIYLPSEDEFCSVWGVSSVAEGLAAVPLASDAIVVVKQAEQGATGKWNTVVHHVDAFPVRAENTLGAGDAFNTGFIAAQLQEQPLDVCMRFGAATAALKISMTDFPSLDQVEKFLQTTI